MARPAGNAGEGLFILAGVVVAAAGWRRNQHLGEWWWKALVGTIGLCIVAALFSRTKAAPIVKGIGWLTFMSACIYALPAFKDAHQQHIDHVKHVATTRRSTPAQSAGGSRTQNPV